MVPPLLSPQEVAKAVPVERPALHKGIRAGLMALAAGLTGVFTLALVLDPYDATGQPRRMETHRQLGLPPCTFYSVTGLPCPSCGMTTSFALLVRGDVWGSLRANAVGTLLAIYGLLLIPWSAACVVSRRLWGIRSLENALIYSVIVFLALLLVRWGVLLAMDFAAQWLT